MTSRTHDIAALTALNLIIATQPIPSFSFGTVLASVFACFIGGLMPDLDEPTSEFWQKFPAGNILGQLLHGFGGGHRRITHSILGFLIISFLIKNLLTLAGSVLIVDMNLVFIAFLVGYLSHFLMDMITEEGIPLFFPIPYHFGIPPIRSVRLKTGGIVEKFIIFPLLLFTNFFLFYRFYPVYINLFKMFTK